MMKRRISGAVMVLLLAAAWVAAAAPLEVTYYFLPG